MDKGWLIMFLENLKSYVDNASIIKDSKLAKTLLNNIEEIYNNPKFPKKVVNFNNPINGMFYDNYIEALYKYRIKTKNNEVNNLCLEMTRNISKLDMCTSV